MTGWLGFWIGFLVLWVLALAVMVGQSFAKDDIRDGRAVYIEKQEYRCKRVELK